MEASLIYIFAESASHIDFVYTHKNVIHVFHWADWLTGFLHSELSHNHEHIVKEIVERMITSVSWIEITRNGLSYGKYFISPEFTMIFLSFSCLLARIGSPAELWCILMSVNHTHLCGEKNVGRVWPSGSKCKTPSYIVKINKIY